MKKRLTILLILISITVFCGCDPNEIIDQCPEDPYKTESGKCGCGIHEGTCSDNDNKKPVVLFNNPTDGNVGSDLGVEVDAYDPDGFIDAVVLYINDTLVRSEETAPYQWGSANSNQSDNALMNLTSGTYQLRAEATDNERATTTATLSVTVTTGNSNEAFTFVQIADPQLGIGGYEHDIKTFNQAVKQINQLNPDFVVICGDLVHKASETSYADFLKIKNKFTMPCYVAPGNHDVGGPPTTSKLSYFRQNISKDYYTFQNKGFSFIVTNTQLWKYDIGNESNKHNNWFKQTLIQLWNYEIGKESDKHDNWFKQTLIDQNNPVFVIGHHPLYVESLYEEESRKNLPKQIRTKLLNQFEQNNVKAYLHGHSHKTKTFTYNSIQLVGSETTSKAFDHKPLGFRLWEVSSDKITHRGISLTNLR